MPGQDSLRREDIVDAEFISVGRASAGVERAPSAAAPSSILLSARPQIAVPAVEGMAMLSRSASANASQSSGGPMFWAGGTLIAMAAFWVAGGHAIIAGMSPEPADHAAGLRIASVISRVDRSGAKPLLLVDGKAVNEGTGAVAMPPLNIQVVSAAGISTLYKLGTAGQALDGGGSFDFSSRLDLPKDGVQTVFVTFAR